MVDLYDRDRKPLKDASAGCPLYSEAMIFTGSRRWVMLKGAGSVSPVRSAVKCGDNSYSAVRRQIASDTGITVNTGAVPFTGCFTSPDGTERILDIWVFRLDEKDEELRKIHPGILIMSSDEIRDCFDSGTFMNLGEEDRLRAVFTVYETPVCVDF